MFLASLAFVFLSAAAISPAQTKTGGAKKKPAAVKPELPKVIRVDEISFAKLLEPPTEKAKPLLINFWATWCVPCREEFPDLVKIDEEFHGKIDFITVSLDDLVELNRDVPQFLREMNAKMPAYLLYTNRENEVIGSISKDWGGGLPFSVLYDEKRNVVLTKQGKIEPEVFSVRIRELIEDQSGN